MKTARRKGSSNLECGMMYLKWVKFKLIRNIKIGVENVPYSGCTMIYDRDIIAYNLSILRRYTHAGQQNITFNGMNFTQNDICASLFFDFVKKLEIGDNILKICMMKIKVDTRPDQ